MIEPRFRTLRGALLGGVSIPALVQVAKSAPPIPKPRAHYLKDGKRYVIHTDGSSMLDKAVFDKLKVKRFVQELEG